MQISRYRGILAALILLASLPCPARAGEPAIETIAVRSTYNNAPFQYRSQLIQERRQLRIYRLAYPSPVTTSLAQNNTIPADFYVPKQLEPNAKYPAVICLHILDGNEPLTEIMCSALAARGIPAISFKLPYYGSRGGPNGPEAMASDPKMFVGAIHQAGEDIRRTIDLLASRPEINPKRIGITGISLGGIIAASAAGADPRLHRAGLLLAGGDVLSIVHHARETQPLSAMIRGLPDHQRSAIEHEILANDPLRFAPALRDRAQAGRVLMLNAAEDEVIPRQCTERLAAGLGISDRVVWFPGVGHYTVIADLPDALRRTADFFAQDLPADAQSKDTLNAEAADSRMSPLARSVALVKDAVNMLATDPLPGRCHVADLQLVELPVRVRFVRGSEGKFSLHCQLPEIGAVAVGVGRFPWLCIADKTTLVGSRQPAERCDVLGCLDPNNRLKLRIAKGIADSIAIAPDVLQQWISATPTQTNGAYDLRLKSQPLWCVSLKFKPDGNSPDEASLGMKFVGQSAPLGTVKFLDWRTNATATDALFEPPAGVPRQEVEQQDLLRVFAAAVNFGLDRFEFGPPQPRNVGAAPSTDVSAAPSRDVGAAVELPHQRPAAVGSRGGSTTAIPTTPTPLATLSVLARDPAGHGLLAHAQGKTILMVAGTPAQMGAAQGTLLREPARKTAERVLYLVGGGDTVHTGQWFFDRMAEIQRRTTPHIPPRFLEECDALGRAAGVSQRDARLANLFPERFHCSGVALKGRATQGGRVLHARVLDYMRDIDLQQAAAVQVFMPERRHAWLSLGYAGFIGTVTAMNERGLAIGEMGGRGEGLWDGIPMSLLLRDVMERAATVDEALTILREAPRTCEYYYVLSDRSGAIRAVHCTPQQMLVLEPGQQHPQLPLVPEDTVLVSGEDRAKVLSRRIVENYGRIDVAKLIEIIKRPVAMEANLHNAIFAPETLDVWFADATRSAPACDQPYACVNLRELVEFYKRQNAAR
ncbi:MAG: C45 family autoproteolytic acyltransferase/hydrolase [Planctomycetaceae bacterium]|nr:C45 family autoproteolytic acyltransferase/hydrolase [Planctomycetaceae bacterium]